MRIPCPDENCPGKLLGNLIGNTGADAYPIYDLHCSKCAYKDESAIVPEILPKFMPGNGLRYFPETIDEA